MKKIICLLLICSLLFSCKSHNETVKNRHKRVNPHKLHKYPDYKIYHKKWEN